MVFSQVVYVPNSTSACVRACVCVCVCVCISMPVHVYVHLSVNIVVACICTLEPDMAMSVQSVQTKLTDSGAWEQPHQWHKYVTGQPIVFMHWTDLQEPQRAVSGTGTAQLREDRVTHSAVYEVLPATNHQLLQPLSSVELVPKVQSKVRHSSIASKL